MKVDIGGKRHSISDFVIVETQAALELIGTYHENLFYYVKADNLLKTYTKNPAEGASNWKNINDTSELESAIAALGGRLLAVENTLNGYTDAEGKEVAGVVADLNALEETVEGLDATDISTTQDIVVTSAVGNYAKGSVVRINDLQEIIKNMLSTDIAPSVTTAVSASLTLSNSGAKEVGTEVTPSFSFSTNKGKYSQYRDADTGTMKDQATGVSFSDYSVAENGRPEGSGDNGTSTASSGSFAKFTVTEALTSTTPYKLTGSCKSSAGEVPKSYLGIPDSSKQIAAKDWTGLVSNTITGYRAMFYGYYDHIEIADPTKITSAQVRALSGVINTNTEASPKWETKTGPQTALPSGKKEIKTNKMQQMFFAAPAGKYSEIAVANSTNGAPQTVTKVSNIMVEGANGYTAAAYDVFYVSNAGAESGETIFDVTLS